MQKKIIIVGGVAGGATAAARLRRLDESSHIIPLKLERHDLPPITAEVDVLSYTDIL